MNKVEVVQSLFDNHYISKQDCISFFMEMGASERQMESFKARNASDSSGRVLGFPDPEVETKASCKRNKEIYNETVVSNPKPQKGMF